MKPIVMIPARMESNRFPGKPLATFLGKPIIQWVYERAVSMGFHTFIVSPDREIADLAYRIGATFISIQQHCINGTERCYLASQRLGCSIGQVIINIQGDQILFDPETVAEKALNPLPFGGAASFYGPCYAEDRDDKNVVKVTMDRSGYALYFSRFPITYQCSHVGIYMYEVGALQNYLRNGHVPLETAESLEQMRWLWMGRTIEMFDHPSCHLSINTPKDIKKAEAIWKTLKLPG